VTGRVRTPGVAVRYGGWCVMHGCAVLVVECQCQCRDVVIIWSTMENTAAASVVDNGHHRQGRRHHHGHHRGSAKIRPFLPRRTCVRLGDMEAVENYREL